MNDKMIRMLIQGLGINPEHFEKVAASLPELLNRFAEMERKVNRCYEILEGEVIQDTSFVRNELDLQSRIIEATNG